MNRGPLKTGEVESLLGIPSRTLQNWVKAGLVDPPTSGYGHARYGPPELRRLRLAKLLARHGYGPRRLRALLPELATEVEAMVAEAVTKSSAS